MASRRFRKPYRVRRKKSILGNRFFWLGFLFILLITGAFYFICFSKAFEIKEVQISGNQKVQRVEIESLIKEKINRKIFIFIPKNNLFFINTKTIKEEIFKKYPQISEISLERELPNRLILKIVERQLYAIWCKNEQPCFYIDKEGVIFEEAFEIKPESLVIKDFTERISSRLGAKAIEKNALESIFNIKNHLENNLKITAEAFTTPSLERLNVKVLEGWEIYFNLKEDINWQLTKLNSVLKEEVPPEKRRDLEYIDLRFSRVYYKYRQ